MADLSAIIRDAYQTLCGRETSESGIDIVFTNDIRFIGIDVERKADIDLAEVRKVLLEPFPTHENPRIVQVIGDSGTPVRSDKLAYVQQLLDRSITNDTVIEYGFTRSERDANWFVENVATRNPAFASQLIGNIVQVTMTSISPPTWSAFSQIKTLAFVYRREGPPTSFGDDVWLSDGVMTSESEDAMICLEGGPQALTQCVNVLLANIKVIAITGLREESAVNRFSAAGLLAYIMQNGLAEETTDRYLAEHPPKLENHCDAIRKDIRRLLGLGLQATNLPIELHLA